MREYEKLMIRILLIISTIFFSACQKKSEPIIIEAPSLYTPIKCISLNRIGVEPKFINELEKLYDFNSSCNLKLNLSYKKDIVCNSSYNVAMKSTGQFPKSYLKLELRDGMKIVYSYYIDLYNNVNTGDIKDGFLKLKMDLIDILNKEKK